MSNLARSVTGGVDTHLDVHVAAALDEHGASSAPRASRPPPCGYRRLLEWLEGFGPVVHRRHRGHRQLRRGPHRHLHRERIAVVEVDRPNRQRRRRKGKSDPQDAISAAHAAHSGDAMGLAKTRDGDVESMRVLRVARISARNSRTQALNQMRSLVSTAPTSCATELRSLNVYRMLERALGLPPGTKRDVVSLTKFTLRTLARRAIDLQAEIDEIDAILKPLVEADRPRARRPAGRRHRRRLRAPRRAGDNPHGCATRPRSRTSAEPRRSTPQAASSSVTDSTEAGTARRTQPSGTSSSPAWSTTQDDRVLSHARMKEGKTKEAMRCLKRYVARELFPLLPRGQSGFDSP